MILDWPEVHRNMEILLFGSSKPYPSISREKKKCTRNPSKWTKPTPESKRQWQNDVLISILKDGILPGLSLSLSKVHLITVIPSMEILFKKKTKKKLKGFPSTPNYLE